MFNLLPEILKNKIKVEYKRRWLIIVLTFVLFIQISSLIFLFPTWIVSIYKEKEAISLVDTTNKASSKDGTTIASIIVETNTKLNIINTVMQYPEVRPLVDAIISNKISSIHINGISYTFKNSSIATLSLQGVSDTRDALVLFVKNLQNSKSFKDVNLPVSNFAKDKNIDFTISITI